jgi:hypothetical protein
LHRIRRRKRDTTGRLNPLLLRNLVDDEGRPGSRHPDLTGVVVLALAALERGDPALDLILSLRQNVERGVGRLSGSSSGTSFTSHRELCNRRVDFLWSADQEFEPGDLLA